MNKTKLVCALVATGLMFSAGPAAADGDQPWHVTGQVGGMKLDSNRDTRDNDVWWGVGFGRFFGNNFSLDVEYDQFKGTFAGSSNLGPGVTYDKWGLKNIGIMGRWHFGDKKVRPYVALGFGRQEHRNVYSVDANGTFSLGGGIRGQMAKHFSGFAQVLYRMDMDGKTQPWHDNYEDWIYSVGVSFDFGGKPPPPPPAPKSEPPPPPPPPPNPDLDGDGVLNEHDKCPNTRKGAVVDLDGCEVEAVISLEGVHFDFDKATLRPEAKAVLDGAAALLDKHERVVVEVAGHTDSTGPEDYNQGLSERRANSVKDYLVSKGVQAQRLQAKGYGESMPVASNDTKEGRAENRRVELIVLDR